MMTCGKIVALAVVVCVAAQILDAQSKTTENTTAQPTHDSNAERDLKMTTIGHGKLVSGHSYGFRIYEAPDGSQGEVSYATLPSVEAAQGQI